MKHRVLVGKEAEFKCDCGRIYILGAVAQVIPKKNRREKKAYSKSP